MSRILTKHTKVKDLRSNNDCIAELLEIAQEKLAKNKVIIEDLETLDGNTRCCNCSNLIEKSLRIGRTEATLEQPSTTVDRQCCLEGNDISCTTTHERSVAMQVTSGSRLTTQYTTECSDTEHSPSEVDTPTHGQGDSIADSSNLVSKPSDLRLEQSSLKDGQNLSIHCESKESKSSACQNELCHEKNEVNSTAAHTSSEQCEVQNGSKLDNKPLDNDESEVESKKTYGSRLTDKTETCSVSIANTQHASNRTSSSHSVKKVQNDLSNQPGNVESSSHNKFSLSLPMNSNSRLQSTKKSTTSSHDQITSLKQEKSSIQHNSQIERSLTHRSGVNESGSPSERSRTLLYSQHEDEQNQGDETVGEEMEHSSQMSQNDDDLSYGVETPVSLEEGDYSERESFPTPAGFPSVSETRRRTNQDLFEPAKEKQDSQVEFEDAKPGIENKDVIGSQNNSEPQEYHIASSASRMTNEQSEASFSGVNYSENVGRFSGHSMSYHTACMSPPYRKHTSNAEVQVGMTPPVRHDMQQTSLSRLGLLRPIKRYSEDTGNAVKRCKVEFPERCFSEPLVGRYPRTFRSRNLRINLDNKTPDTEVRRTAGELVLNSDDFTDDEEDGNRRLQINIILRPPRHREHRYK